MANLKVLATLIITLTIVNLIAIGFFALNQSEVKVIEKQVPVVSAYNDTAVKDGIAKIDAKIFEDENWKDEAEKIAIDEYSERSFKDIFNFLESQNVSIEDKSDIRSVVVTDTEVKSFDVNDKDAIVVQELKVRYEDKDSDTVLKAYLVVTTEIEDNEVTDQEFEFQ